MLCLALLCLTLFLALLVQRQDAGSPLMWCLVLWSLLFAIQFINPMGLRDAGWEASLIVAVGLVAMAAPALAPARLRTVKSEAGGAQPVLIRLVVGCIIVGALVAVGVYAFRAGVASAVGADFNQLTPSQVRAAQTGAARGGGLFALFAALNPLLACLGLYGYLRFSRLFGLVTVGAIAASLQTPARLTTVMLIVQATVFYYYCRRRLPLRRASDPTEPRMGRKKLIVLGGGAVIASISFFNYFGSQLGKVDTVRSFFPNYSWPSWTLSPFLYLTGGYPALSQAITSGADPFQHPGSVFVLARVWAFINPTYQAPDTLADYVPIPIPFNVYTGFGEVWYDFGFVGTAILSGLLGFIAVNSHRRAMAGQIQFAWISSLTASLLLALPQTYRLFFLDIDLSLVVGFLFFAWLPRTDRRKAVGFRQPASIASSGRDTRGSTSKGSPRAPLGH